MRLYRTDRGYYKHTTHSKKEKSKEFCYVKIWLFWKGKKQIETLLKNICLRWKKMTNFEKIKKMSVEEMASEFNHIGNMPCCVCSENSCYGDSSSVIRCIRGIEKWLKSEVEE